MTRSYSLVRIWGSWGMATMLGHLSQQLGKHPRIEAARFIHKNYKQVFTMRSDTWGPPATPPLFEWELPLETVAPGAWRQGPII